MKKLNGSKKNQDKKSSLILNYLRYLIFVITISNFIFIGTIGIHEFGHYTISKLYNCEPTKIVFENNLPYTETICKYSNIYDILLWTGILLPILLGLLFLVIGGKFLREIGLLVIGFNFIGSYKDLIELKFSDNLILISIIFGLGLLTYGIFLLTKLITEDEFKEIFNV